MFGHGEKNCHVKTHCANCSQNHATNDCNSISIKCANCNETHKANDPICMSRQSFCKIRDKLSSRNKAHHNNKPTFARTMHTMPQQRQHQSFITDMNDFPAISPHKRSKVPNSTEGAAVENVSNDNNTGYNAWSNSPKTVFTESTGTNVLFSMEEINSLTAEMILLLGRCNTKAEQFNTIAQLAVKYLYSSK